MATLGALPVRWLLVMLDAFLSLAIARHYLVMLGLLDLFAMLAKLLELQGRTLVGAAADGIRQRLGAVGIHLGLMPGAGHGHVIDLLDRGVRFGIEVGKHPVSGKPLRTVNGGGITVGHGERLLVVQLHHLALAVLDQDALGLHCLDAVALMGAKVTLGHVAADSHMIAGRQLGLFHRIDR